jgi:TorA maturation chaperone TorD
VSEFKISTKYSDQYRLFSDLFYHLQQGNKIRFLAIGEAKNSLYKFVSRSRDLHIQPILEVYIQQKDELRMEFAPSNDFEYYRALKHFIESSYQQDNYTLENLFSV